MEGSIDKDKILAELMEMAKNAKVPECPKILFDDRLEDAFKEPVYDEDGYSEAIPAIWGNYEYEKLDNIFPAITKRCALISSNLYSKYLDEAAIVWDQNKDQLLLYIPDKDEPRMAFKGSAFPVAKKLKPEYKDVFSLTDILLDEAFSDFPELED